MLSMIGNYDLDERLCERAYRPEILERELKISADIDKRIEKAMQRLVLAKEFKKQYRPKEVYAQVADSTALLAKSQACEPRGSQGLPPLSDNPQPTKLTATSQNGPCSGPGHPRE